MNARAKELQDRLLATLEVSGPSFDRYLSLVSIGQEAKALIRAGVVRRRDVARLQWDISTGLRHMRDTRIYAAAYRQLSESLAPLEESVFFGEASKDPQRDHFVAQQMRNDKAETKALLDSAFDQLQTFTTQTIAQLKSF